MINATKLVEFLSRMKITANQYLFCHLIYTKQVKELRTYVKTTYTNDGGVEDTLGFTQSEVSDLVHKGYLEKMFQQNSPFSYIVTEKFSREIFIDIEEAGQQIWDTYPKTLEIDGQIQTTRGVDKEAILEKYAKLIGFSKEKHKEVMHLLHRYKALVKEGRMGGMGIAKWISGENWDVVKEIEEGQAVWKDEII